MEYANNNKSVFTDAKVRKCYEKFVTYMKNYLGHELHIGGKYYDAYPSRNLPKYGVLKVLGNQQYELLKPYTEYFRTLIK